MLESCKYKSIHIALWLHFVPPTLAWTVGVVTKSPQQSYSWGGRFPREHSGPAVAPSPFSLFFFFSFTKDLFKKTIIPGHFSWMKPTACDLNSLFYSRLTVCAAQLEASLPACKIVRLQHAKLSPSLQIFSPGAEFTANPTCCLWCLLSLCIKARVTVFPSIRCSGTFSHSQVLLQLWSRTCLCPVVSAAFLGPLRKHPGKKKGSEYILQAITRKHQGKA